MVRIGLIGTGARGRALLTSLYHIRDSDHLPPKTYRSEANESYRRHGTIPEWLTDITDITVTITDLYDPSEEARRTTTAVCQDHGDTPNTWEMFDDFLTGGEFEAVLVASPNDQHVDPVLRLMDAGIDTFCEKPVATTLTDHDRLINAVSNSTATFVVGFNLRSSPIYTKCKELIDDGTLGDLGMITAQNVRFPFPVGFRYSQQRSGGALLEKNCHDFDLFNWYADGDPIRVSAAGGQHVFTNETDIIDHASVIVEYDCGLKATLELCLYTPFTQNNNRTYSLRGTKAIVNETDAGTVRVHSPNTTTEIEVGDTVGGHGGADLHEMVNFIDCVESDGTPTATLEDAKRAGAVAFAAEDAIREQETKRIDID